MEPYDTFWDSFEDYIFKPFFWITLIGFLPAILVGILFGKWIKKSK
jgi:undecaprenyl pyrophosphate phosphatase UppP